MPNKNKKFAFRVSEKDLKSIKQKAGKAEMTTTDYLTQSALNRKIVIVDGLQDVLKELKGIGRNLNQLTILCNMNKIQCLQLDEVKFEFAQILEQLMKISGEKN